MDVCTVRKSDGFMTLYTPAELTKMARKLAKEHGNKASRYDSHWVCFDSVTNEARLIVAYKMGDGWMSSIGKAI